MFLTLISTNLLMIYNKIKGPKIAGKTYDDNLCIAVSVMKATTVKKWYLAFRSFTLFIRNHIKKGKKQRIRPLKCMLLNVYIRLYSCIEKQRLEIKEIKLFLVINFDKMKGPNTDNIAKNWLKIIIDWLRFNPETVIIVAIISGKPAQTENGYFPK